MCDQACNKESARPVQFINNHTVFIQVNVVDWPTLYAINVSHIVSFSGTSGNKTEIILAGQRSILLVNEAPEEIAKLIEGATGVIAPVTSDVVKGWFA